ncbi:response regulator [Rhizobium leguminosarum]|uniref:response regulator transcription factor n=1 Tax=Rhizobium leguminosarum TaxID=384 RepID=UPI001C972590|nr:response regulator [Rhizobium leguminosarum]MBY5814507.1 response regulator [Rhizobium leguminosarum]
MIRASIATTTALRTDPRTVLIADPAVDKSSGLVDYFLDNDFEVLFAATAREVRQFAATMPVPFAMLEVRFPDGDLFDLVGDIRAANPKGRILIHSAYCNLAVAVAATKAGATDVLPKPVQKEFVLQLLLGEECDPKTYSKPLPCPNVIRKEHIRSVYAACNWNVSRAAHQLSMHRRTLQRILKRTEMLVVSASRLS